jgi:Peptidase A4 family
MPTTTLPDGMVITTFPAPPALFDLEKVTDSERAKYGIPRFPPGTELDKRWKEMARNLRLVEPVFKQRERRRKFLPGFESSHGQSTSTNWSGGVVNAPAYWDITSESSQFSWIWSVLGSWNIPDVSLPIGAQKDTLYSVSTWVGIDGSPGYPPSSDVLQAGCDSDVFLRETSRGLSTFHEFNPWFEWFPAGSFYLTSIPASAGDEFWCWIQSLEFLEGSTNANSALIFLINVTQAVVAPFAATAPVFTTLQGASAEWIVEAWEFSNKTQVPLAKYTPVSFKSCKCVTVNDEVIDVGSGGNTINMINSSNQEVISQATIVGSDEVEVSYV